MKDIFKSHIPVFFRFFPVKHKNVIGGKGKAVVRNDTVGGVITPRNVREIMLVADYGNKREVVETEYGIIRMLFKMAAETGSEKIILMNIGQIVREAVKRDV